MTAALHLAVDELAGRVANVERSDGQQDRTLVEHGTKLRALRGDVDEIKRTEGERDAAHTAIVESFKAIATKAAAEAATQLDEHTRSTIESIRVKQLESDVEKRAREAAKDAATRRKYWFELATLLLSGAVLLACIFTRLPIEATAALTALVFLTAKKITDARTLPPRPSASGDGSALNGTGASLRPPQHH